MCESERESDRSAGEERGGGERGGGGRGREREKGRSRRATSITAGWTSARESESSCGRRGFNTEGWRKLKFC